MVVNLKIETDSARLDRISATVKPSGALLRLLGANCLCGVPSKRVNRVPIEWRWQACNEQGVGQVTQKWATNESHLCTVKRASNGHSLVTLRIILLPVNFADASKHSSPLLGTAIAVVCVHFSYLYQCNNCNNCTSDVHTIGMHSPVNWSDPHTWGCNTRVDRAAFATTSGSNGNSFSKLAIAH